MPQIRPAWWLFIGLEGIALIAWVSWGFVAAPIVGEALWVLQFVLLLPGSLLAVAITEGPLWNTGLSLQSLAILDLIASIGFNAVLWWFLLKLLDSVRKITAL